MLRINEDAENHFVSLMNSGKLIYRDGELWKTWDSRKKGGWLSKPVRTEKIENSGYYRLKTTKNGKHLYTTSHRVIWVYFNGKVPSGLVVNHKNGIKQDNRLENLELVTSRENALHAFKLGLQTRYRGEDHVKAKLTNAQVVQLKELASSGRHTQKEVASMFGVSESHVCNLLNGRGRVK